MKKIFAIGTALFMLAACELDFVPSDSMTSSQLKDNPSAAVYTTDGIYSLFKDNLPYKGQSSGEAGNVYLRHYFQLTESRGDNVTVSGNSEDPFISPYRYEDVALGKNKTYTWWMAYKIIYAANSNIDGIDLDSFSNKNSAEFKQAAHLLGENYFFRALGHFHMVTLFAMPYVCGRDNPGVPLRIGMDYSTTTRASVGQVYDAIVKDLKDADKYMSMGTKRGDASYVSATAAKALLSRVYLYMGDEHLQDCIDVCDDLIGNAPASVKAPYDSTTLSNYPKATWSSPETIWCVHFTYPTDHPSPEATIGAMYICQEYSTNGWGEWYWSDELIELFNRYKKADGTCADNRFRAYFLYKWYPDDVRLHNGKVTACFPTRPSGRDFATTSHVAGLTPTDGDYNFTYEGTPYVAKKETVGGYTRYYIEADLTGDPTFCGGKTPVYIREDISEEDGWQFRGNAYMPYMNSKFAFQDGQCTMSSPVMIRWGEVFLNRAEAYARLGGKDAAALDDVNLIRARAGLPDEAMFNTTNYTARGYTSVLDVVLDERRMELCFEGQRVFDVFRNKKTLDRRYVGYHPFETINYDDPRIAMLIPDDEVLSVDGYKQNDQGR